jgi:hypothetical protein
MNARRFDVGKLPQHGAAAVLLLVSCGVSIRGATAAEPDGPAPRTRAAVAVGNVPEITKKEPPALNRDDIATVNLGNEQPGDQITHLFRERDGRTTVMALNGVPCRYLNRKAETRGFGYLYFLIDPEFKDKDLETAKIELECLVQEPTIIRLQYDAMEGEAHKKYKSVLATARGVSGEGSQVPFSILQGTNGWQKVTFRVTNAAFLNSQNGGADFRFEFKPAEIYARRVTVTREKSSAAQQDAIPRP